VSLADRWAKLEPRERSLLTMLMGLFAAIVVLGVPLALWTTVSSMRDGNQEVQDTIESILESREKLEKLRAAKDAQASKYARTAPPMATFLEDAARTNQVELAETTTKPDIPHGKKYVERITVSKMRKTGLRGLAKTLERIARSGYPVSITRLGIKPRVGEPDSYDVELSVSAFEKKSDKKKPAFGDGDGDAADGADGADGADAEKTDEEEAP
jgi:general secretion pathway protein M